MSWKEYKKKKEQEENKNTNKTTTEISSNNSNMTSWEKYKLKIETSNKQTSSWEKYKTKKENKTNVLTTANKDEKENTWFKSSNAFDNGYQFGNITGTIGATIGDVGVNLAKGAGGLVEGVGDLISYGVADVQDWTGHEEAAEKTRANAQKNTVDELFKPTTDYLDKYSVLGEKSDSIAEGLGYVAAITAVSVLSGGVGAALGGSSATAATIGSTAATFTSAMGNGMTEALNDGADIDAARIYGAISGAGEAVSELAFGGLGKASEAIGLSRGALDDIIAGGLTKNIKNKMLKTIVQSGIKAGGEGFEEVLSGLISAAGKKAIYMKEKEFFKIAKDENLAEQFWMGALTSAIAQGPSTVKSAKSGTDYITGRTNNEQKVYDNEVKERTNEKIRQSTIEQAYNEQIKAKENLGIEITDKVKAETMKKVENAYNNGTLKSTELSKKDLRQIERQVDTDMQEGNISAESIMKTLGENQDISKDNLLMRSMYENEQKYNSYQVEKTDNEKVNILMQSASDAGMNNTSKTRKKVELISKLVQDTDRQYKFVSPEQLKEMGYNEKANGLIDKSTGEILINTHSDKGIQSIVGHETTHIFDSKNSKGTYSKEYQTLQDAAIEYAKTKGIYNSKIQSITEAYGDLLVDESQIKEELTADLVGDFLFNDEKFIENLAIKDRNVFQKIYDYIKHTYKMVKGTEEEKAFENLKRQFEKVYKTISTETNTDTKYSIAGEKAIEKIKNTKLYKDAEDNLKLAKQLKEAGKSNLELVKKTGWFQDQAGDWKFEFSDRNMELKEINFAINKEYNLSDVLEHDELFYFYPELANYTVIFKNKSNSSHSAEDRVISLNYQKLNNSKELKGTLIHEIQHAIQNIENYAHGTTTKLGLMRYYNTLGEIEAADTKERYLKDIKGKNNTILPESGKKNPTHTKVKNGDTLVKIANGVYNFFHGGEKNVYKNKKTLEENFKRNKTLVDERGRIKYSISNQNKNDGQILNRTNNGGEKHVYKNQRTLEENYEGNRPLVVERGRIKYSMKESENNSGSFSMQDSKGRKLSKEQQEYFKDSKVRDENGNLKTMYHGSNNKFSVFKHGEAYRGSSKASVGYWFTETAEGARNFANSVWYGDTKTGAKIYEVYLDIKKPKIYEGIDNTNELHKIDNKINNLKEIIRKLENKNIAIEINKQELRWANSKEELRDIAKYEGIDFEDAENYHNAINQYNELIEEYDNKKYNDSYEMFRTDIYKIAGKSAKEANIGGTGMYLSNEEEVVKQYVEDLKKQGYDGIIIKNTKFDNETLGKDNSQYVVFDSNQIKNVSNINPTDNLDINLSLTNDTYITGDDIAVKDLLVQEKNSDTTEGNIVEDINNYINNEKFPILEVNKENKDKKLTRKEVKKQLLEKMNIKEADISVGEDISALNFQITDPIRVNEKVFGRKIGSKINEVTTNQTKHNTAEKIRWQNKEREEIASLGIKARSKESAAVQKYGEKKYVDEFGNSHDYGDTELANEFHDTKTQEKIKYAATVIRNKYDNYIDSANNILTRLGYDEIPKRKDYMRHFQELTDKFSEIGIPLNLNDLKAEDLPTDINGLTEFNKPGKSWFASAMKRTGEKTVYDAITGIDGYIEGIGNIIFHTEDVQNYRALSSLIRDTYGQTHGFDNLDNMTEEEAMKRIKDVQNNKLSKYVAWLDEQANSLAGKKGAIDRGFERFLGRKVYTVFNTAKKQVGSNMTGFNIRACLTNLISSTLAASKTKKIAFVKGTISTISNIFKQDDFIDKSDFLTSRFGSDLLSQKFWQKASNAGQIFMSGTDWFTSNQIVRSKYYEGLSKGMAESEAIKYADDFASRVMGDRSQGATAELFNSKTLGLFTQFQLEVNNQWQFMMHDTKMDYQQNKEENNGLKAGATAVFQIGQLAAYSYFFNELFEKLTGSRAAFDPIEIIKILFGYDDDDEKTFDERLSEAGKLLVENIPFANLFTDGGRIPVSEAFTGISTLGKKLTGGTDEYGNELTWQDVKEDVLKTIPYWVMPAGYSQAKKTVKGLSMYLNDVPGSYNNSGDLRYTVDDDVGSKVKSAIFGAYANPYAQDYIDSGYKTIKKDNIDEMVGLDMNSTEYREYKKGLNKVSKTTDENGYKQYTDDSNNVYWYDVNSEVMYDSNYNKTTLTADDLTKTVKTEEALNYISSLDLTDTQKNLAANNLNKNSKKTIDMSEYSKYSSYDEYKYARDNPEKYSVVSKITDYDSYTKYKDAITDIKKQYSTELGYESKERKTAVQSYINSLDLNIYQKMMLEKMAGGYSIKDYQNYIYEYLESIDLTDSEKYTMWEELFN